MSDWLPAGPLLGAFVVASTVLAVTPGPGVVYIVTRTLSQGRWAGYASLTGVALGNLGNAVGSALGLAALFTWSTVAFDAVRYAGAGYLLWLAITTWRAAGEPLRWGGQAASDDGPDGSSASASKADAPPVPVVSVQRGGLRVVRDGALVALLNPKTTLFFAAFLPQFVDPAGATAVQSVALGMLFVAIAALSDVVYVTGAAAIARRWSHARRGARWGRRFSALIYLALAMWTALAGQRPAFRAG